jgi:hypothetical protein
MQLPEFTHSTTLRWTLLVVGTFAAFIVALLVTAIVKLHGFRFTIVPGSGCVAEIACPYAPTCCEQQEPAKINALVTDNVSKYCERQQRRHAVISSLRE